MLKPLGIVLLIVSLVLVAIAMAIAPGWRRQVLRAYGVGFIVAGAAALLARSLARRRGRQLPAPRRRPASRRSPRCG